MTNPTPTRKQKQTGRGRTIDLQKRHAWLQGWPHHKSTLAGANWKNIEMDADKLQRLAGAVRMGGKGSMRR